MQRLLKRTSLSALIIAMLLGLGGCVYGPGYYQRTGVTYDDEGYDGGRTVYYDDAPYYSYAPAYYGPYWYGYPWLGLSFSGVYFGGHHHDHDGGHHWHSSGSSGGHHSHH